jgi:flavin reductase (DIM6/NTAB) family NADH-FMN oxidoreductase RutF
MKTIGPKDLPLAQFHNALLTSVAPRPICFASTIDSNGEVNLSPFSFFNIFGSNPVTFIFSPARRVRDNSTKHTLNNILETKEVVINVVNYAMVQQMSLASCEYPKGINEFVKAGFTELASEKVKPPRVKESPVQFECIVKDVIETGTEGGAGNLIIAEMVLMHVNEEVLNLDGTLNQHKLDLVGRLGSDWYVRASGDALFEVPKPAKNLGIGFDQFPEHIKNSTVLTGNDYGKLGNVEALPDQDSIEIYKKMNKSLQAILQSNENQNYKSILIEKLAKELLDQNEANQAWKVLLAL